MFLLLTELDSKLHVIFKNLEIHHPVIQALESHDEAVWGRFTAGTPAWLIQKNHSLDYVALRWLPLWLMVSPERLECDIPEQTQAWEERRRKHNICKQTAWGSFSICLFWKPVEVQLSTHPWVLHPLGSTRCHTCEASGPVRPQGLTLSDGPLIPRVGRGYHFLT